MIRKFALGALICGMVMGAGAGTASAQYGNVRSYGSSQPHHHNSHNNSYYGGNRGNCNPGGSYYAMQRYAYVPQTSYYRGYSNYGYNSGFSSGYLGFSNNLPFGGYGSGPFPTGGSYGGAAFPSGGSYGGGAFPSSGAYGSGFTLHIGR